MLLWAITTPVYANLYHDSKLDWKTIQTEHYRIHYHTQIEEVVRAFLPKAEETYTELTQLLNWLPEDKIDVVFTDEYDISNGFARIFPRNNIQIYLSAPDSLNTLEEHNGWLELVFKHELLHIVHLDKGIGGPLTVRNILGRQPLPFPAAFPNAMQPTWYIEGLATYVETDPKQDIGRGQSKFYDMLMRMEVAGGVKPIRQVNQPITTWPGYTTSYLYGVNYYNYIRDDYNENKIYDLVDGLSVNIIPYRILSNTENVFFKTQDDMWNGFTDYLNDKHRKKITEIVAAGLVEGKPLSDDGYIADSVVALGDQVFYSAFNYRSHPALMVSTNGGPAMKVRDLNNGARLDVHKEKGILITQPQRCRNANLFYDIYRVDPDGSNYQRLTHCSRYRQAVWSNKGDRIVAAHNQMGMNSLDLLDADGNLLETLWQGKHNEQIGRMTYSPTEDKLIAAVWRKNTRWNLEMFDLNTKQWTAITADEYIQNYPAFTEDGKAIVYTSDDDGVYNIYKLDLESRERARLSNVQGGAFYPVLANDNLYYIGYSPDGANLYQIKHPTDLASAPLILTEKNLDSSSVQSAPEAKSTSPQVQTTPAVDYSPWKTIGPSWWLPYFQIDDQRTQLGIQTAAVDALDRHLYTTHLAVDLDNDWLLGRFDYFYDRYWPILHLGFGRDTDIYLDSNGETARIRDDKELVLETVVPFTTTDSSLFLHMAVATKQVSDLWTADNVASQPTSQKDIVGVGVRYVNAVKYPISVSRSEGRDIRLVYESSAVGNSDNKGQITTGEWREFLYLGREHVLALRWVEGRGYNNSDDYRLGGIQSNYAQYPPVVPGDIAPIFDKQDYTLRGYDEGPAQLSGQNMRLVSAEYHFPLWLIERGWMAPPLGINQLHGTLFYDIGGVWGENESSPPTYYAGAGFELNADLDLLYNLPLNVSLGYASGFDDQIGKNQVYLRIGAQF